MSDIMDLTGGSRSELWAALLLGQGLTAGIALGLGIAMVILVIGGGMIIMVMGFLLFMFLAWVAALEGKKVGKDLEIRPRPQLVKEV